MSEKRHKPAIARLARWLCAARLDPSAEDLADMLWLWQHMQTGETPAAKPEAKPEAERPRATVENVYEEEDSPAEAAEAPPEFDVLPTDMESGYTTNATKKELVSKQWESV